MHPHDERPYAFCPMCGGDLEPRSIKTGEPERLVCARCGFIFYLDPKVAVGTIITDDQNHIVLVRRAIQPGYGKWVFPGGFVDRGEEVRVAAVREAREETGLEITLERLLNVYSYRGSLPVIIVYTARLLGAGRDPVGRAGIPQYDGSVAGVSGAHDVTAWLNRSVG